MSNERKTELRMVSVMEVIIAIIVVLILLLFVQQQEHERELTKFGEPADTIAKLEAKLRELEKKFNEQDDELSYLRELKERNENLIEYYQGLLSEREPSLAGLTNKNFDLETKINELSAQIEMQKNKIDRQAAAISKLSGGGDGDTENGLDLPPCYFAGQRILPHIDLTVVNGLWVIELPSGVKNYSNTDKVISQLKAAKGIGQLLSKRSLFPSEFYKIAATANRDAKASEASGKGCVYFVSYDRKQLGRQLSYQELYNIQRYFYTKGR